MLMTEAPAESPLLDGCWVLLLWPLDFGNVGGAGNNMGKPKTSGGEKEKRKKKKTKTLYPIAPDFERIGWAGELLNNSK